MISCLYSSSDFTSSSDWLGNYVLPTKGNHVKDSRMWLSQGINAKPLTDNEFKELVSICKKFEPNIDFDL